MSAVEAPEVVEPVQPPTPAQDGAEPWRFDKNGEAYVPRGGGRPGIIKRQGDETVAQARERDASASTKRPRPKPKTPKMPKPPRKVDLKVLEEELAGALKAPGAIAMQFGDEWTAEHFVTRGPYLARQLVLAAEHNPWLRGQLESMAVGEDALMKVIAVMNVGGALVLYLAPPVIYLLNLPVPDKARLMMGVPDRKEKKPPYAAGTPRPESTDGPPLPA